LCRTLPIERQWKRAQEQDQDQEITSEPLDTTSPEEEDSSPASSAKPKKDTSTQDKPKEVYSGEITPEKVEKAEEEITFKKKQESQRY
jgi:hypothetical protein